ncbi:MAG: 5'-nucleotidase C-terminal domain-containing protein [Lachnospiraceae bacterium]|nr:5'-nucleotidase C-terminal domain-containing protein [Lachnospiraceae bacterium]
MKKLLFKLLAFALVIAMILPGAGAFADETGIKSEAWAKDPEKTYENYEGMTVILHSNDVHGSIEGYTYIKGLKKYYENMGAEVITVDAGDYLQGDPNVNLSKGKNAVTMMNAVGYDFVTLGNHEFDYGYARQKKVLKKANFTVLCADIFNSKGKTLYKANAVWESKKSDLKIGFFGLDTPEAQTKANPALIKGLKFVQGEELYKVAQEQVDILSKKADIVIALTHLGVNAESEPNTSYDLYKNTTGIDLIIDGHSHTVMTFGPNGEPIQSTGTKFQYVGMVMIDNATKEIVQRELITADRVTAGFDKAIDKKVTKIVNKLNKKLDVVFAKSEVELFGLARGDENTNGVRNSETNMGDLLTDALLWEATKEEGSISVDKDHIVCVTNGGGIREDIKIGDITMRNIITVFPYSNTVSVIYLTGKDLLEALEASTFSTPGPVGGFPHVSGMKLTINTKKAFAQGEQYPDSTYYAPKKIKRVTIDSINGKKFNKNDTYAVVTNDFLAGGGDTYYVFANATNKFDTGIVMNEAVVDYITNVLGGVIGSEYAEPQGRITIKK